MSNMSEHMARENSARLAEERRNALLVRGMSRNELLRSISDSPDTLKLLGQIVFEGREAVLIPRDRVTRDALGNALPSDVKAKVDWSEQFTDIFTDVSLRDWR